MRAVLTRVKHASVTIDGKVHGQIGEGFLILLGVTHEDTEAQAVKLADKLTGLRIFEDENGKMNRGLDEVKGELLIISQFTLYGTCKGDHFFAIFLCKLCKIVNIGFAFKLAREHTLAKFRKHGVFDSECGCKTDVYSELFSEIKVGVHTNGRNALLCKQIGNGRRRKPFYRGKNYGMMTDNQLTSQTIRLINNIFRNV